MKGRMCLAGSAQGLKRKSPDACCFTGAVARPWADLAPMRGSVGSRSNGQLLTCHFSTVQGTTLITHN